MQNKRIYERPTAELAEVCGVTAAICSVDRQLDRADMSSLLENRAVFLEACRFGQFRAQ
jgi:hypothetical protein